MGQNAAETVREIEEIRERLSADIDELQSRLPPAAVWGKRAVGALVGGGLAATAAAFLMRRRRAKRRRQAPVQAVVNVLPEDVARRVAATMDDDRLKRWALMIGGAWLLFKLAELRQLRRMRAF